MSNDDNTGGARLFKNTAQQGKKVQEGEGRRAIAAITAELMGGGEGPIKTTAKKSGPFPFRKDRTPPNGIQSQGISCKEVRKFLRLSPRGGGTDSRATVHKGAEQAELYRGTDCTGKDCRAETAWGANYRDRD
jgi:hypothetical protein